MRETTNVLVIGNREFLFLPSLCPLFFRLKDLEVSGFSIKFLRDELEPCCDMTFEAVAAAVEPISIGIVGMVINAEYTVVNNL